MRACHLLGLLCLVLPAAARADAARPAPGAAAVTILEGAGATFPLPLYQRWLAEYRKLRPEIEIRYQGTGSAAGIQRMAEGALDFGATDEPMSDEELRRAKVKIIHLPTTVGAVVPVYNLPQRLRFSGETLAEIFLGKVPRWDDPALARDNPGVKLPRLPITVVHRSDGSGTTFIWAESLSKVSPEWVERMGPPAPPVKWPVGKAAQGNEGVAALVGRTPGALGYVELSYAQKARLSHGAVRNAMGEFVAASPASLTAAAVKVPSEHRVSLTNAMGKGVYPVASYSWLLLNLFTGDEKKSAALRAFLKWALSEGQAVSEPLGCARLPQVLARREALDVESLR